MWLFMLFQPVTSGSNFVPVKPFRFMKDRLQKYHHGFRSKLPKILKDMVYKLCKYYSWATEKANKIEMIGYVQSGKCLKDLYAYFYY